jgi:copper(I)-binding protein
MKKAMFLSIAAAGVLAMAGCGSDDSTEATTAAAGQTSVTDAWARVTTPTQTAGAVYMTIESPDGDTLMGASVPSSVAGEAQLHETTDAGSMDSTDSMDSSDSMDSTGSTDSTDSMDSTDSGTGMMGMKEVDQIDIPAGETVTLEPGGYHIMLIDLAKPIESGDTVPVTLDFEKAGKIEVDATAREE